jgi:REP element-mobilizing transposase RayT
MANTFSQIYLHIIIVVSGRLNIIKQEWEDELYKYISGIVHNKNQKIVVINGTSNHIHLLLNVKTDCCISYLIRDIKSNSSRFINDNHWGLGKFKWQSGSGIFSVSHSQIDKVHNYIDNQ